jgi:streptogramin lyase
MRPLAAAVVALCSIVVLPSPAVAGPTITEFSSGITAGSAPRDIVAGPDGALWFTESSVVGRLGRITTSGEVTEFFSLQTVGGGLQGIAAGPDGALWFTQNSLLHNVGRSTLLGAVTKFTSGLTPGGTLRDITVGPDGNLWATWSANPGRIVRITPSGTITEFTAGLQNNNAPTGIAAGPDGNVWFTEKSTPAKIGRVTPSGVITEFRVGLTNGSAPEDIVAGPDGNLWFTQEDGIGRITPAGVITEFTAGVTPDSRPTGIAAGSDGNLWFTQAADPGRIGRITTDGAVTEFSAGLSADASPLGIAAGPDGNMWFTQHQGDRIGRITIGPGVSAGTAVLVDDATAVVTATVRPNSQATTFTVEHGPTTSYGRVSETVDVAPSAGPQTVSVTLSGLASGTVHRFRTVAANGSGVTRGRERTLITVGERASVGRTVVAGSVAGVVRVRRPGSSSFAILDGSAALPVGSVIDSSKGRIEVVSALPGGATQSATFWGGVFQVRQTVSSKGMVDIHLRGPAPSCATLRRAASHSEDAVRRPVRRTLWGKDSKGKYRTHGRNSVATVRGTVWMTSETCAGTLTRVTEGAVAVRDVARKKTVLVRKGGSYLARARR